MFDAECFHLVGVCGALNGFFLQYTLPLQFPHIPGVLLGSIMSRMQVPNGMCWWSKLCVEMAVGVVRGVAVCSVVAAVQAH